MASDNQDVWAEEPGIRLKATPWHGGIVLKIYEINSQRTMIATISAHRWKQILALTTETGT